MTSICMRRSIVGLLHKSNTVTPNSLYILGRARVNKHKLPEHMQKDDFDDDDGKVVESKISKTSMDKIKQRFTSTFKRPDLDKQPEQTEEEKELRLFIHQYDKYRKEIEKRRDDEEKYAMHYQWEAIAELPEDLRKTAMLVDTHDDAPDWIPFWTLTPPSEDPASKMVMKKKVKAKKRSEELLTGNLF
ncbi:hypothetical protein PPL_08536 [Heterostelium album PN500]|uniref:Uncharacterized protein n=1 Tax=Heterostelium pallidum (strain ATCC 26659 / Pp 5 / PN500) TaxID=670386 RepID=D3BIG6_HETP5|nr:hypothetical protein PPL_08536 [Heterostelium album PN500]EFA79066.1 hypothetical protein PPL_08536 [Heterostelium album PN500]|eukprot:XP_020431189.1 hypothetical protein PPL_08536 [Heterostelium album PN500]